jgi:hypothetical protein
MKYHLAEINIARFRVPAADPVNADFISSLDRVNAMAELQPGFIWRLKGASSSGESNSAIDIHAFDDPNIAINMSVWSGVDALADFVYRNAEHLAIMRRRREWFDKLELSLAMWWIPAGHVPTAAEGKAKLELLARLGPTPEAFRFRSVYAPPDGEPVQPRLDECA